MTTPQSQELTVGYDAREHWLTTSQLWAEQRQQAFLYRLDVLKPLSVDTRVWPTIWEAEERPPPEGRVGFQTCWADLASLQEAVTRSYRQKPLRAWRTIAITLLLGRENPDEGVPWSERLPPATPDQRGPGWEFLGYDVAD